MKKWLAILWVGLIAFACSMPASLMSPTLTTPVETVYRTPSEVNLQPEDVPELSETDVENPTEEIALATQVFQSTQTQSVNATNSATATAITPPTLEGPTPTEDICISLNLTPKECANAGTHLYSGITKGNESTSNPCTWATDDGGTTSENSWHGAITFTFSESNVFVSDETTDFSCVKNESNIYYCEYSYTVSQYKATYVFSKTGFVNEWYSFDSLGHGCYGVTQASIVR